MLRRHTQRLTGLLAALVLGCGAPALAQVDAPPGPGRVDPLSITGRTFAGLGVEGTPIGGPIRLACVRAWAWDEHEPGSDSNRLLLEGDVRLEIGVHRLTAARAVIWMEPAGVGRVSFYAYLDRARTPQAEASVAVDADRLPVSASVLMERSPQLSADALERARPTDPFVLEGERVLAAQLRRRARGEGPGEPGVMYAGQDPQLRDATIARSALPDAELRALDRAVIAGALPGYEPGRAILPHDGTFAFSAGRRAAITTLESEHALSLTGDVVVQFESAASGSRSEMSAARAVVFFASTPDAAMVNVSHEDVRGLYLEGDVVVSHDAPRDPERPGLGRSTYTVRCQRVYYDVQRDRAVLLDAVLWTHESRLNMPLYLRADVIRQESERQFSAGGARLTNSGFAEPHLSLGASSVRVTLDEPTGGSGGMQADAQDLTIRAGPVPFFYWPRFVGDPTEIPLRDVRLESTPGSGQGIRTAWNLFSLIASKRPSGLEADLLLDYFSSRGWGLGTDVSWAGVGFAGDLFAYVLPDDAGTDILPPGTKDQREGGERSLVYGSHRWVLDDKWTLLLRAAWVSDERLVLAQYRGIAKTETDLDLGADVTRRSDNSWLGLSASGSANDFATSEVTLQSPGYQVFRQPEATYVRLNDDVLPGVGPDILTYSSEYRAGRLQLSFTEPTAGELGFTRRALSERAFGVSPDESIGDRLREEGYTESAVTRADTRHELSLHVDAGPVRFEPFLVGRFTGYDDGFSEYGGDDDSFRLWGAAGLRASTSLTRVYDGAQSRVLGIHRLRHIIEPSVTVWHAGTTIDRVDLPVYDESVEGIAEGTALRVALDQTWQTKRGGPGRWYDADLFSLRAEFVTASDDADRESPFVRWIDSRPEYSELGDAVLVGASWQLTESTALNAHTTYDLDLSQPSRTSGGWTVQHSQDFSSWAQLRYLNPQDSTVLAGGIDERLTDKYIFSASAAYDSDESRFQSIVLWVARELPNVTINFGVRRNEITDETDFMFRVRPFQGTGAAPYLGDIRAGDPGA